VALKEEDGAGGTHFLSRSQKIKRRSGEKKKKRFLTQKEKKNEIFRPDVGKFSTFLLI